MGLGWLLTARSVLASLSSIRPSSKKRLSIRAPMGYPHRRPVIKTKLPGWDRPIKRDKKGKRGFVSRGTPFRAMIMPEQISGGQKGGKNHIRPEKKPISGSCEGQSRAGKKKDEAEDCPQTAEGVFHEEP